MGGLKESGPGRRRAGHHRLADAAAPTVLDQAARLQSRQRFFNLIVTNVPGPQVPLYVMGRGCGPSTRRCRWCSTPRSGSRSCPTTGRLYFGLLGDYDAMADLDALAADLDAAIRELAAAAGVPPKRRAAGRDRARRAAARHEAARRCSAIRSGLARPIAGV